MLGFPEDITDEVGAYFWKNTLQVGPRHRITGLANHWSQEVNYFFFGFPPALAAGPDASMLRKPGGDAVQGRWDGLLSDRVVAEANFGWNNFRLHQLYHPFSTVAVRDLVTGIRSGNPGNGSRDSTSQNLDWNGSVSWMVPGRARASRFQVRRAVHALELQLSPGRDRRPSPQSHQRRADSGRHPEHARRYPFHPELRLGIRAGQLVAGGTVDVESRVAVRPHRIEAAGAGVGWRRLRGHVSRQHLPAAQSQHPRRSRSLGLEQPRSARRGVMAGGQRRQDRREGRLRPLLPPPQLPAGLDGQPELPDELHVPLGRPEW